MNEITKIVKSILSSRYGFKNVSVTRGKGTASGWVDARITVAKPENCFCTNTGWCQVCREKINKTSEEAREVVYAEMEKQGKEFYNYSDDMGGENDCFSLRVSIEK